MEGFDDGIHPHCLECINFKKCSVRAVLGVSCELISCHLDCGAVFHACKKQEHKILCLNEKVPCYNKEAGCPCVMQRKQLAKHLSVCPASVIHCTMEWSRWHINEISEKRLIRCKQGVEEQNQQPQLDIALALRDQRLLKQWYSSGKSAQIDLRDNFPNQPKNYTVFPLDIRVPDSIPEGVEIPDLRQGLYSQLYEAMNNYGSHFGIRKSNYNITVRIDSDNKYEDENKENMINNAKNYSCTGLKSESNGDILDRVLAHSSEHSDIYEKVSSGQTNQEKVQRIKDDVNLFFFDEFMVSAVVPFPTRYLGLDSNVEVLGKSLIKIMFTFLCSQEFRRDEYSSHYKNVHCEIHSGLNGWLQERCPLAQYGCPFSRQRFNPMPAGSKIVYNELLESFGVVPPSPECLNQPICFEAGESMDSYENSGKHNIVIVSSITQLPYEILRHIASFLDGFSLSNLALTCSLMRDVCQSLLIDRGIVTLQWERKKEGSTVKWEVANKRWCFSSHFSPIHDWCFDDSNSMSDHLKNCIYFDRKKNTGPFNLFNGHISCEESLYKKITNNLDGVKNNSESITTKL